jgi:hypothetical protein
MRLMMTLASCGSAWEQAVVPSTTGRPVVPQIGLVRRLCTARDVERSEPDRPRITALLWFVPIVFILHGVERLRRSAHPKGGVPFSARFGFSDATSTVATSTVPAHPAARGSERARPPRRRGRLPANPPVPRRASAACDPCGRCAPCRCTRGRRPTCPSLGVPHPRSTTSSPLRHRLGIGLARGSGGRSGPFEQPTPLRHSAGGLETGRGSMA